MMAERKKMMEMSDLRGGMDLKETFILKAFNFQKIKSNITSHDIVSQYSLCLRFS